MYIGGGYVLCRIYVNFVHFSDYAVGVFAYQKMIYRKSGNFRC